jgi:hypothetical protein
MRTLLAILCLGATAWGQQTIQDAQVRGRKIVDEAIAALGGDKFLSVENRVETGRAYSFDQDGLNGLSIARYYTRYITVDPAMARSGNVLVQQEHQALGKDEAFYNVFREEGGWEVTYRGPKPLDASVVARKHDTTLRNIFYILRNRLQEPGLTFEARGSDVLDNTPVNVVDVIDAENRVVTVYFHPTTKLPLRQSWKWRDPDTKRQMEEVTRFSRYREVDGTQWPFQTHRERNGRKIFEMFADTVAINQMLDERRFAIPDATARPIKTSTKLPKKR